MFLRPGLGVICPLNLNPKGLVVAMTEEPPAMPSELGQDQQKASSSQVEMVQLLKVLKDQGAPADNQPPQPGQSPEAPGGEQPGPAPTSLPHCQPAPRPAQEPAASGAQWEARR